MYVSVCGAVFHADSGEPGISYPLLVTFPSAVHPKIFTGLDKSFAQPQLPLHYGNMQWNKIFACTLKVCHRLYVVINMGQKNFHKRKVAKMAKISSRRRFLATVSNIRYNPPSVNWWCWVRKSQRFPQKKASLKPRVSYAHPPLGYLIWEICSVCICMCAYTHVSLLGPWGQDTLTTICACNNGCDCKLIWDNVLAIGYCPAPMHKGQSGQIRLSSIVYTKISQIS